MEFWGCFIILKSPWVCDLEGERIKAPLFAIKLIFISYPLFSKISGMIGNVILCSDYRIGQVLKFGNASI